MPNRLFAALIIVAALAPALARAQDSGSQPRVAICASEYAALGADGPLKLRLGSREDQNLAPRIERFIDQYREDRSRFPSAAAYAERNLVSIPDYATLQTIRRDAHLFVLRSILDAFASYDQVIRRELAPGRREEAESAAYLRCLRTQFAARVRVLPGESYFELDGNAIAQVIESQSPSGAR